MGNTQCMYSLVEAPLVIPRQYNEVIHAPEKNFMPLWRNEQACLCDSTVKSFVVLVCGIYLPLRLHIDAVLHHGGAKTGQRG